MQIATRSLLRTVATAMGTFMLQVGVLAGPAEEGFTTIFNGKDLTGWDGDPLHWSVADGVIRGDSAKNKAKGNTFLVWRDGTLKDFELKLKYRIHGGNNSGVQYRSKEVSKWVVSGYQAEVQNMLWKTGFLYHERGRGWLVDVGDMMEISKDGNKAVVGIVADQPTIIKAPYHVDKDWNEYHFICRGNHVIHVLNGYQTVELIDNHVNEKNPLRQRCMEGVLALQVHAGAPMTVDFKDIRIKHLTENFGEARRLFNGTDLEGWSFDNDAAKAAWSVVPLDEGTPKPRRGSKLEATVNVLNCAGNADGLARVAVSETNYILRYQKRAGDDRATGGDATLKPVLGWHTVEVRIDAKGTTVSADGITSNAETDSTQGRVVFPSNAAADYRNVVLIPLLP